MNETMQVYSPYGLPPTPEEIEERRRLMLERRQAIQERRQAARQAVQERRQAVRQQRREARQARRAPVPWFARRSPPSPREKRRAYTYTTAQVHVPGMTDREYDIGEGPEWPHKAFLARGWFRMSDKKKLRLLRSFSVQYGRDPRMREFVINRVMRQYGGVPRNYEAQAAALLKWTQTHIRYYNETAEQLQSPWYTIEKGFADCDDQSILIAAMAESIRLPWKFVLGGRAFGRRARWIEGQRRPRGFRAHHIYLQLGWPPFRPTTWASAEPTLNVPLGYDVIVQGMPGKDGGGGGGGGSLPEMGDPSLGALGELVQKEGLASEVVKGAITLLAVNAIMLGLATWARKRR